MLKLYLRIGVMESWFRRSLNIWNCRLKVQVEFWAQVCTTIWKAALAADWICMWSNCLKRSLPYFCETPSGQQIPLNFQWFLKAASEQHTTNECRTYELPCFIFLKQTLLIDMKRMEIASKIHQCNFFPQGWQSLYSQSSWIFVNCLNEHSPIFYNSNIIQYQAIKMVLNKYQFS